MAAIHDAIIKVMEQVGSIGKNRKNDFHKYSFRGIDDIYNELHKPLVDQGVFCTTKVVDVRREEHTSNNGGITKTSILTCDFEFFANDGSSIVCRTVGEASDNSDKATNKAMSAAFKYCLLQLFCIPTDEAKDSENDSPSFKGKVEKAETKKPDAASVTTGSPVVTTKPVNSTIAGGAAQTNAVISGFFQADGPPTGAERKGIQAACAMMKYDAATTETALKDLKSRNQAVDRMCLILGENDKGAKEVYELFKSAHDASTATPPYKLLEALHNNFKDIGQLLTFSEAWSDVGYRAGIEAIACAPF